MKKYLEQTVLAAAARAHTDGALLSDEFSDVTIEEPKFDNQGDFATNFAMVSAKTQKRAPTQIAQILIDHMQDPQGLMEKVETAGPGFINFFLKPKAWPPVVRDILETDTAYGAADIGQGRKIQVEFVSANPTGPLHIGHGRGAAVGDSMAKILTFCGYDVQREYYINDSGRQITTLGRSVYLRCRELLGETVAFPEDCYQGDYIKILARAVLDDKSADFLTEDEDRAVSHCARYAAREIIAGIRADLNQFGVVYDNWYSEQSLFDADAVDYCLEELKADGTVYKHENAWWFQTTRFGDAKDRVVIRQNGLTTYFASDIAYHRDKFQRGFQRIIDVWGADHHGYIPRMTAAVQALGHNRDQFQVILIQLVNLLRGGQPVAMSTRSGEFVTLKAVIDEVGSDAARFIFLTRDYASPLDFDLELAKQKTNDNPVYYVQYVHARIASILRKASASLQGHIGWQEQSAGLLSQGEEIALMKALARYPEVVQESALNLAPHRITYYLMDLASLFHTYYNKHRVLSDDTALTAARLALIQAVQKVIRNGLGLLGVSAPEQM
jgi:arginyl-tRNA synthetase